MQSPTRKLECARQLSMRLGIQPATLLAWYRRGWVPGYRAGLRPVLFDEVEVRDALSRRSSARVDTDTNGTGVTHAE